MITTILSDFSRVILSPKDKKYEGTLNGLHSELLQKYGEQYPFFDYFEFNQKVLDLYKSLKKKYSLHIFTTGAIQNRPEVRKIIDPIFENIFSAEALNLDKKQDRSYLFIADKISKSPQEILFIDDQKKNIEAAEKVRLKVILYENYENLYKKMSETLNL